MRARARQVEEQHLSPLPATLTTAALAAWVAAQPVHLADSADGVRRVGLVFGHDGEGHPVAVREAWQSANDMIDEGYLS